MRRISVVKMVVVAQAHVLDENNRILGEWESGPVQVFAGSQVFPLDLAIKLEEQVNDDPAMRAKLEEVKDL